MAPEDFFDFKSAAENTLDTKKLEISKVHWIQVSKGNVKVKTRRTLNEMEAWKECNVLKKNVEMGQIKDKLFNLSKNRSGAASQSPVITAKTSSSGNTGSVTDYDSRIPGSNHESDSYIFAPSVDSEHQTNLL
ncbi:hypothetical protein J6590_098209 [Homalodisca vitripennis]|nr:hypothetical protein J6590_098209 [Homalodisca vitripennis]